jgi:16S rRNA (uracil1498-N3)-methyltransferase
LFLIFHPFEEPPELIHLNREEIEHIRARRLSPGDPVHVGDGFRRRYAGVLESDRKSVRLNTASFEASIDPIRILFTALPSGKRWDWLIQKGVELGATHFIPVRFARSERKGLTAERAERVIVEAASQSRRFSLPQILPEIDLSGIEDTLKLISGPGMEGDTGTIDIFVLHPDSASDLNPNDCVRASAFLIGPEGGLTEEEALHLKESGFPFRSMGRNILRIETAAIAALAIAGVARPPLLRGEGGGDMIDL